MKNFISKEKPVLIKGLINGTSADKYWTIENLKNRLGNRTIKVFNVTENEGTNYLFPKYKVKLKEMLLLINTNSTSMVNLFDPDFETFPALRKVNGIKAILNHGDALFIPRCYWHQIKYLDASMSVTFRKWPSNPLKTIATVIKLFVFLSIDKGLNFLQPSKWFKFKQSIAEKRAENFKCKS